MYKFNKTYNQLTESFKVLNNVEVDFILEKYFNSYKNGFIKNEDGTIDIKKSIYMPSELIRDGKLIVKFNNIHGDFVASCGTIHIQGQKLTSSEGLPKIVNGCFNINGQGLTNLIGCPHSVASYYSAGMSELQSLVGAPKIVYDFYVNDNFLTSLEGIPEQILGSLYIGDQKSGKKFTIKEIKNKCIVKGNIHTDGI